MAEQGYWAALLGSPETKRKMYLEHAAGQMGLHVLFIGWEEWTDRFWDEWLARHGTQGMVKIDPPRWDSAELSELPVLMDTYHRRLHVLDELSKTHGIRFLNHPRDIAALLDKRACKARLSRAKLPVTEELCGENPLPAYSGIKTAEELLEQMHTHHMHQVFIKPNYGSGALGVTAFRQHPKNGRMMLYTCAAFAPDSRRLVNTKRLQCIDRRQEAVEMLNHLLKLDCIVERWYAKAEHDGCTYDLRAVVQDGQTDFLLARLSKGPITNLQLNNHPLLARELGLPDSVLASVETLCRDAVGLYPGLRSAGIDILLEKGSLRPRIIEMNGQGDLIYQDIYHENRIYTHQARMLAEGFVSTLENSPAPIFVADFPPEAPKFNQRTPHKFVHF